MLLPTTPLSLSPLPDSNSTAADFGSSDGSPGLVVSSVVFPRPGIYFIAAILGSATLPASPALIAVRPGAPDPLFTDVITAGAAQAGTRAAAMIVPRDASGSRTGRSLDVATWRVELVERGGSWITALFPHPLRDAPGVFAVPFSPTVSGDAEIRVSSYDVGGGLRAAVWGGGGGSLLSRTGGEPDDEWDVAGTGTLLEGINSRSLNGGGSHRVLRAWSNGGEGARVAWAGFAVVDKDVVSGGGGGGVNDSSFFYVGICASGGRARLLTGQSQWGEEGTPPPRSAGDALARSLVNGTFYDTGGAAAGLNPRVPPGWEEIVRTGMGGDDVGGSVARATASAWCPAAGGDAGGVSVVWSRSPAIRTSAYTSVVVTFDADGGVGGLCSGVAGCSLSIALAPADPRSGAVDVTRAVPFSASSCTPPAPAAVGVARARLTILSGPAVGSRSTVRFSQPTAPLFSAGAAAAAWVDGAGGDAAAVRAVRAAVANYSTPGASTVEPQGAITDATGRTYAGVAVRGWPLHVNVAVRDALGNVRTTVGVGGRVTDATALPISASNLAAAFDAANAVTDSVVVWATTEDGDALLPPSAFTLTYTDGVWTASAEVPDEGSHAGATPFLIHAAVNPPFPVGEEGGGDLRGWARLAAAEGAYASGAPFLVASIPRAPFSADMLVASETAPATAVNVITSGRTGAEVRTLLLEQLDAALSTPVGTAPGGWAASLDFVSLQTSAPASASPLGSSRPTLTRDALLSAGSALGGGGDGGTAGFWSAGTVVNVTVTLWQYGSRDGIGSALDSATPARLPPCSVEGGGGAHPAGALGQVRLDSEFTVAADTRHVPLLSGAQRLSASGDAVIAACNDSALAVLWVEPPPGLVDGREGGSWWDALLAVAGASTQPPQSPLVSFTSPLTRTDADSDGATALRTTVTARAPGTYFFGVFVGGALVGAPFSIAVSPAPPSAATSELLAARHLFVIFRAELLQGGYVCKNNNYPPPPPADCHQATQRTRTTRVHSKQRARQQQHSPQYSVTFRAVS